MTNYLRIYRNYHVANRREAVLDCLRSLREQQGDAQEFVTQYFAPHGLDFRALPAIDFRALLHGSEEAVELVNKLPKKALHAPEWLALSSLLVGNRKYRLAVRLREKAMDRIADYQKRLDSLLFMDMIIGKAIEREEIEALPTLLKKAGYLPTLCGRSSFNPKLRQFLQTQSIRSTTEEEQAFHTYVHQKKVAVIGPLNLSAAEQAEIDEFDIVVKVNDFTPFDQQRALVKRSPNIIYYTGETQDRLKERGVDRERAPRFIVGKRKHTFEHIRQGGIQYRQLDQFNPFTLNGGLNMIPRIIIDLTLFRPAQLKIYGVDLYSSLDYRKDYGGVQEDSWNVVFAHFINHDLITQYKFMERMYKNDWISTDERLGKVLRGGLDAYLQHFEQIQ